MDPSGLLHRLKDDCEPNSALQAKIKDRLTKKLSTADLLHDARTQMRAPEGLMQQLWSRIRSSIALDRPVSLLGRIQQTLSGSEVRDAIWQRIQTRLEPVPQYMAHRSLKWTAAFALIALTVQLTPSFVLGPPTAVADSQIMLLKTTGEAEVLLSGLWQPLHDEQALEEGAFIRTRDGEVTIILHDDGVVRLAPHTTIVLHDVTDQPQESLADATLTLYTGEIWVQGLLPPHLRGITVATSYGDVTVHEGSMSIAEDSVVDVRVWNRRAVASTDDDMFLVAGEQVRLTEAGTALVKKMGDSLYHDDWVVQNLGRDAVHRHEIAQLQQERRAARARILPTSRLYPVVRVAEKVDELLTFGDDAKVQKKLAAADRRLSEAAALLRNGEDQEVIADSLNRYKKTLLALADEAEGDRFVQFLIEQELLAAASQTAAALPDDDVYALKKSVLEVEAALPMSELSQDDINGQLLVYGLAAALQAVEDDAVPGLVNDILAGIDPHMDLLTDDTAVLDPQLRKEARVLLTALSQKLVAENQMREALTPSHVQSVMAFLPPPPQPVIPALTEEELAQVVDGIYDRVFLYGMARSQWNQLNAEFRALDGHHDQGRILRRLYHVMPTWLGGFVRGEIAKVRERNVL